MIDALLYAIRDNIRSTLGYNEATCELVGTDGRPPARCGNWFVGVHQLDTRTGPETDNKLEERYQWGVTITQRVVAPLDRVGDRQLAVKLASTTGFNRKADQLRAMLHMAWGIMQDANVNLMAWCGKTSGNVYGFCEPARYNGMSEPRLEGPDWFHAVPEARDIGLVSTLSFRDERRFQAIGDYV